MNEKTVDKYIKYFYAASNFYGAIELDEFVDAYFKEDDYDDLYSIFFTCFDHKLINAYKIKNMYYLTCYDKKGLKECLRQQEGKKLKIIGKKELLKYADKEYYKENELTRYLGKHGVKKEDIVDVVNNISSIYFNFNDMLMYLIDICDDDINIEELVELLKEANNSSEMHANRSYSPNELPK